MGTDKSCGPPSFRGPFEAFEAFWWLLAPLGGFLGFPGASGVKWRELSVPVLKKKHVSLMVRPSSPFVGAALGPAGPWCGIPWPGSLGPEPPLARGPRVLWQKGPLRRGSLGPGPGFGEPLAERASLAGAWQGAPRQGGGQANPEPKTLNSCFDLGLYFSYAKGGLGAGHHLAEY